MKLTLQETLSSRNFYRNTYRTMIRILWVSLSVNVALTVVLFYMVLKIPSPVYYATNSAGAGFVSRLLPMYNPNPRDKELLKPDPPEEVRVKTLDV